MNQKKNIIKCEHCQISLIAEESNHHKCFRFKDLWIIDGQTWIGDGVNYYRLPPKKEHPNKTPRESTEPDLIFFFNHLSNINFNDEHLANFYEYRYIYG